MNNVPFYVLSFFKKGDTIQGGGIIQGRTLFKEIRYIDFFLSYLGLLTEVKLGQPNTEKESTDTIAPIIKTPVKPPEEDGVSKKAQEAISFLKERQEFWSQFKPMYSK